MLFSLISTALVAALSYSGPTFAAPLNARDNTTPAATPLTITNIDGPVVPGQYIVKLKDSANTANHIASMPFTSYTNGSPSPIIYQYSDDFFKGYAGAFSDSDLAAILASPDVEFVQPDAILNTTDQQTGTTWGLQSISTRTPVGGDDAYALKYTYSYTQPAGDDVDIYIIDTGINVDHVDFGGRATFGWAAPGYAMADGNGHGTHCAGTAASTTYGVAKNARLIAVKVLSDEGSGSTSDVIAGLDYVVQNVNMTGNPSVGSMSLGGAVDPALDQAVRSTIEAGIQIAIAAGNSNEPAETFSPARVETAITVAASDIQNNKAWFSNYGPPVKIFAPGVNITSTWTGSNTAVNTISGTSMATPHVAGLCAYLLSKNPSLTPAQLVEQVKDLGTPNVLNGVDPTTPNLLAYNGGLDCVDGTGSSATDASTTGSSSAASVPNLMPASGAVSVPNGDAQAQ